MFKTLMIAFLYLAILVDFIVCADAGTTQITKELPSKDMRPLYLDAQATTPLVRPGIF